VLLPASGALCKLEELQPASMATMAGKPAENLTARQRLDVLMGPLGMVRVLSRQA
jgi:hypothetical protein